MPLPLHEIATVTQTTGNIAELLYVMSAVVGTSIIGGGIALWKAARGKGARDSGIDATVKAVLDPRDGTVVKIEALASTQTQQGQTLAQHGASLARIEHALSANGMDSNRVGDIVARVEAAVKEIDGQVRETNIELTRHVAQHDERDAGIATRVTRLEERK